jgi:hypothetical protein
MNNWDSRYAERVKLLVEILPTLAEEKRFALKGGTAINLFEHDLPRLSVDIDLTWLPVGDFASDVRDISAALEPGSTLRCEAHCRLRAAQGLSSPLAIDLDRGVSPVLDRKTSNNL